MELKVIKRDGRTVKFNSSKIDDALIAAASANNIALTKEDIKKIVDIVIKQIEDENKESVEVEEIQGENAKRMNIGDFLRGTQILAGEIFE